MIPPGKIVVLRCNAARIVFRSLSRFLVQRLYHVGVARATARHPELVQELSPTSVCLGGSVENLEKDENASHGVPIGRYGLVKKLLGRVGARPEAQASCTIGAWLGQFSTS